MRPRTAAPVPGPRRILGLGFAVALALSFGAVSVWPFSADEYGYVYLADTLRRGRLWNAPLPVAEILDMPYIAGRDGKLASQYPPGWSAFLVPFRALGLEQAANPVLLLALGAMLFAALRRVAGQAGTAIGGLLLLSPFLLLNGASLYNLLLACCCIMAVCWLQLRDEAAPGLGNQLGIGLAFSVLLATRYEAFAILLVLYVGDRLWHRRLRFLRDAAPDRARRAAGGTGLPHLYHWHHGSPFRTTLAWGAPFIGIGLHAIGYDGPHSPLRAAVFTARWGIGLLEYAGARWRSSRSWHSGRGCGRGGCVSSTCCFPRPSASSSSTRITAASSTGHAIG